MISDDIYNDSVYLKISSDSTADDLEQIAFAIHSLCGIPTTIRSANCKGLRIERGEVVDREYSGPILEEAIRTNKLIRTRPTEGVYKGKCVVVAPIRNATEEAIGAVGVVDIVAALDIYTVFSEYPEIVDEVEKERKKHKCDLLDDLKEARGSME
ncbi:DUF2111 domain-containing protein [uncultured Methanolobus sp.]|uniref:DUF2111 domain-containing protein n=1 Tax=uncultured Methanolobus sp. TaxID=218300 RepID=UPI0029C786B5|nr:DUF2111 domain-containing protein [uncultured Methanolobus sp.]